MKRGHWIERLMDAQRGASPIALRIMGGLLTAGALFFGFGWLLPLWKAWPADSNFYVPYDAASPVLYFTLLFALSAVASFWLSASSGLRRRTGLGRKIAEAGNFRETCREINRQAASPIFECSGATVMRDWVVFRAYSARTNRPTDFTIAPARDVTRLDVALDPDREGECACRFDIAGRSNPVTIHLDRERATRLKAAVRAMTGREMTL